MRSRPRNRRHRKTGGISLISIYPDRIAIPVYAHTNAHPNSSHVRPECVPRNRTHTPAKLIVRTRFVTGIFFFFNSELCERCLLFFFSEGTILHRKKIQFLCLKNIFCRKSGINGTFFEEFFDQIKCKMFAAKKKTLKNIETFLIDSKRFFYTTWKFHRLIKRLMSISEKIWRRLELFVDVHIFKKLNFCSLIKKLWMGSWKIVLD